MSGRVSAAHRLKGSLDAWTHGPAGRGRDRRRLAVLLGLSLARARATSRRGGYDLIGCSSETATAATTGSARGASVVDICRTPGLSARRRRPSRCSRASRAGPRAHLRVGSRRRRRLRRRARPRPRTASRRGARASASASTDEDGPRTASETRTVDVHVGNHAAGRRAQRRPVAPRAGRPVTRRRATATTSTARSPASTSTSTATATFETPRPARPRSRRRSPTAGQRTVARALHRRRGATSVHDRRTSTCTRPTSSRRSRRCDVARGTPSGPGRP